MGNSQSSSTTQKDTTAASIEETSKSVSGGGLKSEEKNVVGSDVLSTTEESTSSECSGYSSEEEELDEEELELRRERELILADARQLKEMAGFFMHPEEPVQVDSTACARCYFTQPCAVPQETIEESEEATAVLRDASLLKEFASFYLHPENKVVSTDPVGCARNFFSRPSAEEQEEKEEAEERAFILKDATMLQKLAVDYLHPENPMQTTDGNAAGRNYFSRSSAPEHEWEEEAEEREKVFAEALQLQKLAVDYLHPERPIEVDATTTGRNYFTRYSAPDTTTEEDEEALAQVLEDTKQLKKLATDYMHPERPVEVDPSVFGRNFFARPSASEQTSEEEDAERAQVLADAQLLQKLAVDYQHPEIKVSTTHPSAFGRNYFSRPSAPEQTTEEEEAERAQVLADAQQLKQLAVDYQHPEIKVSTTDPSAFGRNYFTRPSAPEQTTEEEAAERAQVLADAQQLKQLAVDYQHPEIKVSTTDPSAFGRNYFTRPSAPEQTTEEEEAERAQILADAQQLKQLAVDYLHPEIKVTTTDPTAFGRNYFSRALAPEQTTEATAPPAAEVDGAKQTYKQESFGFFDMDEEVFSEIRDNLVLPTRVSGKKEDEGDLSRSPSSVMLFGLGDVEAY